MVLLFSISFQYPWWWLLPAALLSVALAYLLYYRKSAQTELPPRWKAALFCLRSLWLFFVCVLLASPLLKLSHREVQKPLLVVLNDMSESINIIKNKFPKKVASADDVSALFNDLRQKFDVKEFNFADAVVAADDTTLSAKATNLSDALRFVKDNFSNNNVGGIVLLSDGIYNQGGNPLIDAERMGYKVHTVRQGDTTRRKDARIVTININKYAFFGNNFPVEVLVDAKLCNNENTELSISDENGQVVATQSIHIPTQSFQKNVNFMLKADKTGSRHYQVQLKGIKDELTLVNNLADAYIEVLDGRQKVALLYAVPHPDVAAINSIISSNENYDVEVAEVSTFSKRLDAYNIVILHGLPANIANAKEVCNEAIKSEASLIWMMSSTTDIPAFNALESGLKIQARSQAKNESQPIINRTFSLFSLSAENKEAFERLPPLITPFAEYALSPTLQTVLFQKIGSVATQQPLVLAGMKDNKRIVIFTGENCWRWRLTDYLQNGSHEVSNDFFNRLFQYASVKQDKSQFRLLAKKSFFENEPVTIEAELYDDNFQLSTLANVSLVISSKTMKPFKFDMPAIGTSYRLEVGMLPPGDYSVNATATLPGKTLTAASAFSVLPLRAEYADISANHSLLSSISIATGGISVLPENINQLTDSLKLSTTAKPIIYNYDTFDDAIHLKWIFFLILLLASLEWFARKWLGSY